MAQDLRNKLSALLSQPQINDEMLIRQVDDLLNEQAADLSIESASLNELSTRWLNSREQTDSSMIKTGLKGLDNAIGGFAPGELIVVGGRPGVGKTQLLVNLAARIAQNHPVLFFTYDVSDYLLTQRFISFLVHERSEKLSDIQLQTLLFNKEENKTTLNNLYINSSGRSSVTKLKNQIRKEVDNNKIKVVFIDYLQMLSVGAKRLYRNEAISFISRELKSFANDLNICIVISSQLSRNVETRGGDKRPLLSDLRDSGAIEEDADKVLFIYRPDYYRIIRDWDGQNLEGVIDLIIAKNRSGHTDTVRLIRDLEFNRIDDYSENPVDIPSDRMNELIKPGSRHPRGDVEFPF